MEQKDRGNAFISVYQAVAGWKAVCLAWDEEEQEYFSEQTSYFAHAQKNDAIAVAEDWAIAEGLEFHL